MASPQTRISCQLCETENKKIEWKCLECELLMCTHCKDKVHAKFKSEKSHNVIRLKDIGSDLEESDKTLDFNKVICKTHNTERCCIYCKSCDTFVCGRCIEMTHNEHELVAMQEGYNLKLGQLKERQRKENKNIDELSCRETILAIMATEKTEQHRAVKQAILNQKISLTQALEKYTNELVVEVDEELGEVYRYIDEERARVAQQKDTLKNILLKTENIIESNDAMALLSHSDKIEKAEFQLSAINICFISEFVPGTIHKGILGSLKKEKRQETNLSEPKINVIQACRSDLDVIHIILTCPDGSLWINDCRKGLIQRVLPENGTLKVLYSLNMVAFSMFITPTGDILITTGESRLKKISTETGFLSDSIYSVPDKIIVSIHLTAENKLIIGARTKGPRYAPAGHRMLVIMDLNGQVDRIFELDKAKNPLFTYPRYITTTANNNFGIVDWFSDEGNGRVVILSPSGDIVNVYEGNFQDKRKDVSFVLGGIVASKSDNFIVADLYCHRLHILNCDGHFVSFCDTLSIGLQFPNYMDFSSTRRLAIAGKNSEGKSTIFSVDWPDDY